MATGCAVLDFGKTHWKAYVVAEEGVTSRLHERASRVLADGPYPCIDVEAAFAFAMNTLAALGREADFDRILPITHGASAAVVVGDRLGLPIMDYEATIPCGIDAEYNSLRPDFAETGSPRLSNGLNLGRQLFWQSRLATEMFARARLLTYPQYWVFRLGGHPGTDISSLGCHTDLWAPGAGRFSTLAPALALEAKFPPLRRAGTPSGVLAEDLARRIGARLPVTLLTGVHDSNAALAALPALGAAALVSTGTWTVVFAPGMAASTLDPARDMLLNVDVFGTPVPSARCMTGRDREITAPGGGVATMAAIAQAMQAGAMAVASMTASGPYRGNPGSLVPGDPDGALRPALATLSAAIVIADMLSLLGVGAGTVAVEGPAAADAVLLSLLGALLPGCRLVAVDRPMTEAGAAQLALGACRLLFRPAPELDPGLRAALPAYAARWRTRANGG